MSERHWQQQIVAYAGAKGVGRCDRDLIAHVVAERRAALDMHSELAVVDPVSGMFEPREKPAIAGGQEEGGFGRNELQVHGKPGGVCGPQYGVDVGTGIALQQASEGVILNFERPHAWPASAEVWCAIRSRQPTGDEVVDDNAILQQPGGDIRAGADN
jgi:hypothetical protein